MITVLDHPGKSDLGIVIGGKSHKNAVVILILIVPRQAGLGCACFTGHCHICREILEK